MKNNRFYFYLSILSVFLLLFISEGNVYAVLKWVELDGSASGGGISNTTVSSSNPSLQFEKLIRFLHTVLTGVRHLSAAQAVRVF